MSRRCDIAVAGAGPVGLAAALCLDRLGFAVTIVAPPRSARDERTAALLAGSVAFLETIGVWPLPGEVAAPLRTLRIVDATARLLRAPEVTFHASEIGLDAFARLLHEPRLRDVPMVVETEPGDAMAGHRRDLETLRGLARPPGRRPRRAAATGSRPS